MTIKSKLTGVGMAPALAQNVVGTVATAEAGAGTVSTNATTLSMDDTHIISTAANNSGVILPTGMSAGDSMVIANYSANTLLLYPPAGGKLNNGSANASVSIATLKNVEAICIDGTSFTVIASA